jgi:hypothetical protein
VRAYGLAGLIAAALALAGCGGSEEVSAPTSFTANDGSVSKLITEALNSGSSPGLSQAPAVHCFNNECSITYVINEPTGVNREQEEILPTRQVWKAIFEDPSVRAAKITVEGPVESPGGKTETGVIYEMQCTKAQASRIEWNTVSQERMTHTCTYTRKAA